MYKIGDKIMYPMHGAGVIRQIKKCEILGETKDYYLLRVPCGDMEVMIPVDSCEGIGVRPVVTQEELDDALSALGHDSTEMNGNWNKRYRENMSPEQKHKLMLEAGDLENEYLDVVERDW